MRQLKITKSITNREESSVEKYLQEINKIPLITPEEEIALVIASRSGDETALEKLVRANLRFVVSVAKKYQGTYPLPDLINEGNIGLIKAAQAYDETKGFKFISYAVWWVRQSMQDAVSKYGRMVRLPLNRVTGIMKTVREGNKLFSQNGYEPTDEELAELLDEDVNVISATRQLGPMQHTSLNAPVTAFVDGDGMTHEDLLRDDMRPADEIVNDDFASDAIEAFLAKYLNPKSHEVFRLYYGINVTEEERLSYYRKFEAISKKVGNTPERVRQLIMGARRKLATKYHLFTKCNL